MQARLDEFKKWLKRIPGSEFIVAEKSGRHMPNEEPELVIDAIRQLVRRAKK